MDQPTPGMFVLGPHGQIGVVDEVGRLHEDGSTRLGVRGPQGQHIVLEPGTYNIADGQVHVDAGVDAYATQQIAAHSAAASLEDGQSVVLPVVSEEVSITRHAIDSGGVRVHKQVTEHEEALDPQGYHEEVSVERVAIGRQVDQPLEARTEGDTLIIPVMEEVLVVEKRLMLKEEIRITKRRIEQTEPLKVVLRKEQVEIERLDEGGAVA